MLAGSIWPSPSIFTTISAFASERGAITRHHGARRLGSPHVSHAKARVSPIGLVESRRFFPGTRHPHKKMRSTSGGIESSTLFTWDLTR